MPTTDHWPMLALRVTTPRLELRLPDTDELAVLADLAAEGLHPPEEMPFLVPWTDQPPAERARSVLRYHWLRRADWSPENWSLQLAVFVDGEPAGVQDVYARDFAVLREVGTGSWLGARYQGKGIGTEMRVAALHLAFAGLGAVEAVSGAFDHNAASLRVSEKLGYERDGVQRFAIRGRPATEVRLRLSRERWEAAAPAFDVPVAVHGLAPCLPLLGAAPAEA
ncbi:GNAT family N-acetyltransferase [Streptomyces marincola]|uniref:GNAT family N-acetyltransferase n=1 Tax=Streptomyces marincola TaxID=2878388 RepID=UPI001CF49D40|nr:GNAT family protein [Streptomyces marincola]UCM88418.1 GNAT family N-acetyltransferase [Streptomyces marincola]